MKVRIIFSISVILFFSCNKENPKGMTYDPNIITINIINSSLVNIDEIEKTRKLPDECNFKSLENYVADEYSLFVASKASYFIHGHRKIYDHYIILFSEGSGGINFENEAYFLVYAEDYSYKFAAFKNYHLSEKFLKAYLFDNYVISISIIDPNYDYINKKAQSEVSYNYVVTKIKDKDGVDILDSTTGREIAIKYLSKYDEYKKIL